MTRNDFTIIVSNKVRPYARHTSHVARVLSSFLDSCARRADFPSAVHPAAFAIRRGAGRGSGAIQIR